MSGPPLARQRPNRVYVWPPKPPHEMTVPSVTTILGNLSKPALVNWAAREVATFAATFREEWQDLPLEAAVDVLKRAPYRNMTQKGAVGTAVHAAIEAWTGGEPTIDPDLLAYVSAAIVFLEDHAASVVESEATIFNRTFLYAGTCDAIVQLKDGRTAICDWKSGKAIYPEVALQLSGYAHGEFIGRLDGTEAPLPKIDVGIVVHLPGDGTYQAREVELTPRLWRTFQALRTLQKWRDDHEADALGVTHKGKFTAENVVELEERRHK